jgi:hypothetical protein
MRAQNTMRSNRSLLTFHQQQPGTCRISSAHLPLVLWLPLQQGVLAPNNELEKATILFNGTLQSSGEVPVLPLHHTDTGEVQSHMQHVLYVHT